jgi:hypothetical protein
MRGRSWASAAILALAILGVRDASADDALPSAKSETLRGTPFEAAPNAAAIPKLAAGASVRRQSTDNTLTADDRARLRGLGLGTLHSSAVALHRVPRTDAARQMTRLRALVKTPGGFAPSEACDGIVTQGEGTGLCTGTVDGPLGKVPVRMPVSAKLSEGQDGTVRLVITNHKPMEAKPLLGWSEVVAPGHLKVVYEMFPTEDGWLVYTRVGVEMSAHEGSAKTISDALLKLDGWLSKELARS